MQYIKGFDGLRAISILLVIFTHLGLYNQLPSDSFIKQNFNLFSGTTGVMIFFTISGFLISLLLLHEKKKRGVIHLKYFYIRRFLRLLPPLLILVIGVFLLMYLGYLPERYKALLWSLFYMYNFVPIGLYTGELGHTWSLGVEEQFYLLWPFVLIWLKKYKRIFLLSVSLILLCTIIKTFYREPINIGEKTYYLFNNFFPDRWFIPACMPIIIGCLAALVLFYNERHIKRYFQGNQYLFIGTFLIFNLQVVLPFLPRILIELLQPLSVALLLLWIYWNQDTKVVGFLEWKPVSFIGKISYGLYIYQGLYLRTGPGGNLDIQQFPLNLVMLVCTTLLSYYIVEKPILKYKRYFKFV